METVENWARLLTMVLSDDSDCRLMPVYLFAETADNQRSSFERAVHENFSSLGVFISGGSSVAGYPGADDWKERLRLLGVPAERIQLVYLNGPPDTKTEADVLIQYAAEHDWKEFAIIAPPFHQLRCFLSLLGSMKTMGRMDLRVYNWVGASLPWQQTVTHSQGTLKATREELIGYEFKRILTYASKGDLVTVDEALEYLKHRDLRV